MVDSISDPYSHIFNKVDKMKKSGENEKKMEFHVFSLYLVMFDPSGKYSICSFSFKNGLKLIVRHVPNLAQPLRLYQLPILTVIGPNVDVMSLFTDISDRLPLYFLDIER